MAFYWIFDFNRIFQFEYGLPWPISDIFQAKADLQSEEVRLKFSQKGFFFAYELLLTGEIQAEFPGWYSNQNEILP